MLKDQYREERRRLSLKRLDVAPLQNYPYNEIPEFIRKLSVERIMDGKSAVSSTTIQGSILALLGSIGAYLEASGKIPLGGAGPIVGVIGAVLSFFGRLKAKQPITSVL